MSKRKPYQLTEPASDTLLYWRGADELEAQLAKNPSFQARVDAASATEFGPGDAEGAFSDPVSRRNFLNVMGASIGLATLEACRRPVEHIVPYARPDEHVNIGVPNHYATVMDRHGEGLGLLVESHEGRPTKIEGNPDHSSSRGAADLRAQASVLDLYDPDRARKPQQRAGAEVAERTYAEFERAFSELLEAHTADQGRHLRVLTRPTISPTFLRLRTAVMARFPQAKFYVYESANRSNAREGLRLALGAPANAVHALQNARVVLSLDSDFLESEPGVVRDMRGFSDSRRMSSASDSMSRLYVVESSYTLTGANADHRLRLAFKDVGPYLAAVANRLAASHDVELGAVRAALRAEAPAGVPAKWVEAVAADLAASRGASAVLVGAAQAPWVHALACAINYALTNVGRTVNYHSPADPSEPDAMTDLRALVEELGSSAVQTLVILGGNPVYEAPADLNFGERLANVRTVVQLSSHHDETSTKATWHVPEAHYLESWGDALSLDGTLGIQQPLIAPLHGAKSAIEILGHMAFGAPRSGYDQVRESLRGTAAAAVGGFDRSWRRILHRGMVEGSSLPAVAGPVRFADVGGRVATGLSSTGAAVSRSNLEVTFRPCPKMHDGRHANVSWLQELPDTITKICWDNAAAISPSLARELSIANGDKIRLSKGSRSIEIVAWIVMGQPENTIGLLLGWGRTRAGRVGTGKGFDVNPLRTSDAAWALDGVTLAKTGATYPIAQTQEHQRMEGRPLAIEATHAQYRAQPNFAEERSHTPRTLPLWREVEYNGYKWGMVVDLTTCTGCNACVVACQAENNIPVVGKDQVARGREMYWLRMDRYFVSPRGLSDHDELATSEPLVAFQPVACVHCEEAPCENVCPVNATSHSPEGLNDMAYNRCIGTRYCANNCPYKVRRFNYLNWHNDGPWQETVQEWLSDENVPETLRMQHNPNVSVRFRGVIEKCSYCVQRIQTAKIQAKNEYRSVRDGEITPACAQTCPAQAITFGDLNDRESRVTRAFRTDRRFKLLAEIGTQPRTTYLAKVRNPNPEMQG